ncbi:MAG: HU family DNA-binding protein [Candidatus Omnitrophica bacterium]|nr:HU family DNA-binding protein [Candidatus Omnitrophota bacterium]
MNKAELIETVAKVLPTKKDASAAVDSVFDAIKGSLKKGNPVTLIGFGTFKVTKRKARTGRNPRTGETLKIPAKNIPVFKAGSELKKAVK